MKSLDHSLSFLHVLGGGEGEDQRKPPFADVERHLHVFAHINTLLR